MLKIFEMLLVLAIGCLIGAALNQTWPAIPPNWETLVAGLLALLGAGLTVSKIEDQIQTEIKQERDKSAREEEKLHEYARARFLMHTNLLLESTRDIKWFLLEAYKGERDIQAPLPPDFDKVFDQNLLLSDNPISRKIIEILEILQIVYARLPDMQETISLNNVGGEPEGTLAYTYKVEWLYISILKSARLSVAAIPHEQDFVEYLTEKVSFQMLNDLKEEDKSNTLTVCRAYLEAYKKDKVISKIPS